MQRMIAAFFNSLSGLKFGLTREPALREEIVVLLVSLPVAPLISLDPWRLAAMWGSLLLLLAVELLNTGLEKLADRVTRDNDELVKIAKDCGSAAVLVTIVFVAMIWGIALWERLFAGVGVDLLP